ncbi:MAG: DUF5312 domain-containing protein [Spirochaetaceae bacterium]|jgi:hypothetical protein|nr:DUF5312 domain-containing protein [Spirochaetaceae bacterium]
MDKSGVFGYLAADLSLEERRKLLDKIGIHSEISRELLYKDKNHAFFTPPEKEHYHQLPWHIRLKYIIMGLFNNISARQIYENHQIARIGKIINGKDPEFYDYRQDRLLPKLREKFVELKSAARFFYDTLNRSINRDKGAFYAFLASLEIEDIHQHLMIGTNPEQLAAENAAVRGRDLSQIAFDNLEQTLMLITEEEKSRMYANVRSLHYLKALSTFPFDRIILSFTADPASGRLVCKGRSVKDVLMFLQNVLFSLKQVPSMPLLESLFIFCLQEHGEDPPLDITLEMRRLLSMAESALMIIRDFNRDVPLTLILRCISRNMGLVPQGIGGGEDWFVAYREYWKRHIDAQFSEYQRTCRYNELANALHQFFNGGALKTLNYAVSQHRPDGFPLSGAMALSFLLTFYSNVFMPDIYQILRTILIEGEFYKLESRTQFTEIYNEIIMLEDTILQFESQLSSEGRYGKYYFPLNSKMASDPSKRRRVQQVVEEASMEAEGIIIAAEQTVAEMIKILEGFIRKDVNGNYDTLVNIMQISSKIPNFVSGIDNSMRQFQQTLQFLDTIDMLELGSKEGGNFLPLVKE